MAMTDPLPRRRPTARFGKKKSLQSDRIDRRRWAVGDEQSLQNFYLDKYEVAKFFARVVHKIIETPDFNMEHFQKYDLHLCEAYCLLWQNSETGSVSGRKVGLPLKIGTFAALFIDLYCAQRLDIYMPEYAEEPLFCITDHRATDTALDFIIFNIMRKSASRGNLREHKLMSSLARAEQADCVDSTLESLIARGILDEKATGICGISKRFPTVNPLPEETLMSKVKDVALKKEDADSFLEALIVLMRESDKIFANSDPILRKHFTEVEYAVAKDNLDDMFRKYSLV